MVLAVFDKWQNGRRTDLVRILTWPALFSDEFFSDEFFSDEFFDI